MKLKKEETNQFNNPFYIKNKEFKELFPQLTNSLNSQNNFQMRNNKYLYNNSILDSQELINQGNEKEALDFPLWNENINDTSSSNINNEKLYADPENNHIVFPGTYPNNIVWLRPTEYIKEVNLNKEFDLNKIDDNERVNIKDKLNLIIKYNNEKKSSQNIIKNVNAAFSNIANEFVPVHTNTKKSTFMSRLAPKLKKKVKDQYENESGLDIERAAELEKEILKLTETYDSYLKIYNKKAALKITNFTYREETENEYNKRIELLEQNEKERQETELKKAKALKKKIKIDPVEIDYTNKMIKVSSISNMFINKHMPEFCLWLSSVYQCIIDNNICDVITGKNIIKKIYPQNDDEPYISPNGRYIVQLFYKGNLVKITIDDSMPYNNHYGMMLPQCEQLEELWPCILTKSLIKLYSSRLLINNDFLGDACIIYSLTGYIGERMLVDKYNNLKYYDKSHTSEENEEPYTTLDFISYITSEEVIKDKSKYILFFKTSRDSKKNSLHLNNINNTIDIQNTDKEPSSIFKWTSDKQKKISIKRDNLDNHSTQSSKELFAELDKVSDMKPYRKKYHLNTLSSSISTANQFRSSINLSNYAKIFNGLITPHTNNLQPIRIQIVSDDNKIEYYKTDDKTGFILNFCYSLIDYIDTKNFNIERLKPLDFTDLIDELKLLRSSKNYKILPFKEKRLFMEEISELKTKLMKKKKERLSLLNSNTSGKELFFVKIKNDINNLKFPQLNELTEEDIEMINKCILNNWKYPPISFLKDKHNKNKKKQQISDTENEEEINKKTQKKRKKKVIKEETSDQENKTKEINNTNKKENENWKKYYYDSIGNDITLYNNEKNKASRVNGKWINYSNFCFNEVIILHNPFKFKSKYEFSIINSLRLEDYKDEHNKQIFLLTPIYNGTNSYTTYNNKYNNQKSSLILIFEPKFQQETDLHFIALDIKDRKGEYIYKDIILRLPYSVHQFNNLEYDDEYIIIIKGGVYPNGYNLKIYADFNIKQISESSYMINYLKYSYYDLKLNSQPILNNINAIFSRVKINFNYDSSIYDTSTSAFNNNKKHSHEEDYDVFSPLIKPEYGNYNTKESNTDIATISPLKLNPSKNAILFSLDKYLVKESNFNSPSKINLKKIFPINSSIYFFLNCEDSNKLKLISKYFKFYINNKLISQNKIPFSEFLNKKNAIFTITCFCPYNLILSNEFTVTFLWDLRLEINNLIINQLEFTDPFEIYDICWNKNNEGVLTKEYIYIKDSLVTSLEVIIKEKQISTDEEQELKENLNFTITIEKNDILILKNNFINTIYLPNISLNSLNDNGYSTNPGSPVKLVKSSTMIFMKDQQNTQPFKITLSTNIDEYNAYLLKHKIKNFIFKFKLFPTNHIFFIKNNTKEIHEAKLIECWETDQPGRKQKAAQTRKKFYIEKKIDDGTPITIEEKFSLLKNNKKTINIDSLTNQIPGLSDSIFNFNKVMSLKMKEKHYLNKSLNSFFNYSSKSENRLQQKFFDLTSNKLIRSKYELKDEQKKIRSYLIEKHFLNNSQILKEKNNLNITTIETEFNETPHCLTNHSNVNKNDIVSIMKKFTKTRNFITQNIFKINYDKREFLKRLSFEKNDYKGNLLTIEQSLPVIDDLIGKNGDKINNDLNIIIQNFNSNKHKICDEEIKTQVNRIINRIIALKEEYFLNEITQNKNKTIGKKTANNNLGLKALVDRIRDDFKTNNISFSQNFDQILNKLDS